VPGLINFEQQTKRNTGYHLLLQMQPLIKRKAQQSESMDSLDQLGTVIIAMVLGAAIGLERELADKPAGLRTHMLVTAASALLVGLGDAMVRHFDSYHSTELLTSDPIRIIEAVITGVSFLGAGTIFRRGHTYVEGLTTAASLLLAAAVGVAVALSQIVLAIGVTALILVTLRGIGRMEQWRELKRAKVEHAKVEQ
jgi:putative Mg2+ transporter-C (MgtC) family protein